MKDKSSIAEQKRFEAELAHERDLLQALMDNHPDFIYFKDSNSRFTRINLAHARHLGLSRPEEAIGKSDADFFTPEAARQKLADEQRILTTGEPLIGFAERSENAREKIWVSSTKVPLHDKDGRIYGLAGVSHNITEGKRAENELLAQRELFRALTDNVPDAIFRVDSDLRYVYVNRVTENMAGIPAADFLGRTIAEVALPGNKELEAAIQRVFATGETATLELSGQGPAGFRHFEMRLVPERDKSGMVRYILTIARDITERKRTEEKLSLQASALEATANGMIITDRAGHILWINPAFTKLTGYSAEEVLGKTPALLKSGKQDQSFYRKMWETILGGNVWHGELVNRRKDGGFFVEEITITPVRGQNGEIQRFIAVLRDISQRKQVEAELAHERDLLQALMDSLPDFIYFKDERSRFTRINQAHARHLGLSSPTDAIGKSDADFFSHGAARQKIVDEQRIFFTGEPLLGLVEQSDTAHGQLWVSSTKMPLRDANGKVNGIVGISHNITERKLAENELLAQRESFRALTDNVPDAIARVDSELRYVYVNRVMESTFGVPSADFLGRMIGDLKLPAYQEWITGIRGVFNSGKTATLEFSGKSQTGLRHWETRLVPEFAASGGAQYVLSITRDVTGQKQIQQKLRDANAIQNLILENSTLGIALVRERHFVWANGRLAELLGRPLKQIQGASARILYPSDEACDNLGREAYPVLAAGGRSDNTMQLCRDDGSLFWCRLVGKAANPSEPHSGSIWMFEDITERKEAEHTRQMIEIQLRQAQKLESIGQLAAGIAHEINTPTQYVGDNTRFLKDAFDNVISLLRSHGELLAAAKQNALTPEILEHAEEVLMASDPEYLFNQIPQAIQETLEGVERITKIVRAMKEFSHPGGKKKTAADLNKAIESTCTVARNEWRYVADLTLELEPDLPLVPCFIGEFNQVILNLVVNAAHAIGDVVKQQPGAKGKITISTRREDGFVEVRVADTGTGIAEANRSRIFEPFFTTKDVGKGTGQGLSLIYGSIVKKHGGTVTFETKVGKGTTFIIRLPVRNEPDREAGKGTPA